jgi:isocitrate lyase
MPRVVSISHNINKASFDKRTLFAGARSAISVFNLTVHSADRSEKTAMAIFDQIVSAPLGRFDGITRPYSNDDVLRLRGSIPIEHSLARRGALKLWDLLHRDEPVRALGAVTGNQAMQMVRAGLDAIYLSGWQAAADANTAGAMYPDQSLYPANTGFGGPLNCFEIMKAYIEAGVAGVHFEDQLASEKKCGHLGGKVLIPTQAAIRNLDAARLAADVCGVPTILVARTDAESAKLITSDVDERDRPFLTGERTAEGFYRLREGGGLDHCISRGLAFAEHADLLWWETSHPNLDEAKRFAEAVHRDCPGKLLAYNCSPSFNWAAKLDAATIARFQRELGAMGYKFQFVTLAGFHSLNHAMFELASAYRDRGMTAYSELQQAEFASEAAGYTATRHQREVGTGYFDAIATAVSGGQASTVALSESTETAQFASPEAIAVE